MLILTHRLCVLKGETNKVKGVCSHVQSFLKARSAILWLGVVCKSNPISASSLSAGAEYALAGRGMAGPGKGMRVGYGGP